MIVTTEYGDSGGVQTMVTSLVNAISQKTNWRVEIASLRMSRRAPESRRLLEPSSWLRRPRISSRTVNGVLVYNVGSALAEVEVARYLPRKWLDSLLDGADVIVVVAGSPAVANVVRRSALTSVLHVATMVRFERAMQNRQLHGVDALYRRLTTLVSSRLDNIALRIPAHVLVINEQMMSECRSRGAEDVQLLPPGIDTSRFAPAEAERTSSYVLMVARLADPRKNVEGLIRAYHEARTSHGLTQSLVLAGLNMPEKANLRLIEALGLSAYVEVLSPVSEEQLVDLYQGADMVVSCSFEEGLGITLLEAMACGVPVLVSDTAGSRYVVGESGVGEIVALGDGFNARFAARLGAWCHDDELRQRAGRKARDRVVSLFSAPAAERSLLNVIAGAAANGELSTNPAGEGPRE